VPEFRVWQDEKDPENNATRATARLPGLNVEIVHRRAVEGDAEQISINLTAAPSFEAFGRALEAANPFAFWAQAAQLAWQPWLGTARALALPWALAPWTLAPWGHALPWPTEEGVNSTRERAARD
jgi:hypothetical protein